jgi:hypothetical protein
MAVLLLNIYKIAYWQMMNHAAQAASTPPAFRDRDWRGTETVKASR